MIRYTLACDNAHSFEAWFRSSADFDGQAERGLLECPGCGSTAVAKALMAPNVVTREAAPHPVQADPAQTTDLVPAAAVPAGMPAPVAAALTTPEGRGFLERLRAVKSKLLEGSENVGKGFAEEARRIHYGEAPARPVHGEASSDEARSLIEEGVEILPLPVLPDERN